MSWLSWPSMAELPCPISALGLSPCPARPEINHYIKSEFPRMKAGDISNKTTVDKANETL